VGGFGLILNLILAALGTAAVLSLAGAIYQRAGRASDVRRFPPLGRLIDIGGTSLHVSLANCRTVSKTLRFWSFDRMPGCAILPSFLFIWSLLLFDSLAREAFVL
jgi:hypothetical protein